MCRPVTPPRPVIECEQPSRKQCRGKGKSDPIDVHLAVLAALRLDAGRLPVPRADGDREALRILLVARQEITEARTAQASRLRALLLTGDDLLAGSTVTGTVVVTAYRQVLADFRPAVLVPALSRVTVRLPTGVPNVYDAPFSEPAGDRGFTASNRLTDRHAGLAWA